ncbi:MAG: bifunctional aspartate kinase/homoserine dehydrogenase I [Gammaproteobacteria bacterium]|nr:bifunctional aspartate kinase/homoserine dehydrogenase I [Gammaproteobacteria bacterium]
MQILKFGGSSVADAACFNHVADIIHGYTQKTAVATVLSAPKGITNDLITLTEALFSSSNDQVVDMQKAIEEKLQDILNTSFSSYPDIDKNTITEGFTQIINRLGQLIQGAMLLGHCPETSLAQILSLGEKFSILLLAGFLKSLGHKVTTIDPEKFLTTDDRSVEPIADLMVSQEKFQEHYPDPGQVSLMPGFFGVKPNGETTTLGRNGSDYSAAILAVCIKADICEVWTDVDGVYNSDPNLVKEAKLLEKMSYREAMELSYFGAKILHPKTIAPLLQYKIPCRIKNTHFPDNPGTLISDESGSNDLIKAVTNLDNVAMVTVSGPEMTGMVGMASRVFSTISLAEISVLMISQSSAEYSISFCVPGEEADAALECLNKAFKLELQNELLEPIHIRPNLAIITLVGDRMQQQRGIAAKFFDSLSQARVNIIAIAQDSSECSISAVVRAKRVDDAIKTCHQNLFLKKPSIDAFIIGCGTIGKELIAQIHKQQNWLSNKNIALNVVSIANSKKVVMDKDSIDLSNWQEALQHAKHSFNLEQLKDFVSDAHLCNPVIVDCTSNEGIAMLYNDFLDAGFHVVTANKKANTASFDYYCLLRKTAQLKQRRFLYETNVGAGLPVIDNLQNLLRAGDSMNKFEGILSGSLSYIFGEIHNGLSLSEATLKARDLGFTEPNPAEDLSGLDVARKALVLAREADLAMELEDIHVEAVVPEKLANIEDAAEFIEKLPDFDQEFQQEINHAEQKGEVLRYIASIENGQIYVRTQSVDPAHPLYGVINGENALAVHTHYYQPIPFVIRGYGAGAEVTAAGLFGDLLKTLPLTQQH